LNLRPSGYEPEGQRRSESELTVQASLRARLEVTKGGTFCHPERLGGRPARLKKSSSESALARSIPPQSGEGTPPCLDLLNNWQDIRRMGSCPCLVHPPENAPIFVKSAFDGRQNGRMQVRPHAEKTQQTRYGAHHIFGQHFATLQRDQTGCGGYFHRRQRLRLQ
jgi:hypothetical protein